MKMQENRSEYSNEDTLTTPLIENSALVYPLDYGQLFHNSLFIDQLRVEKLRAQRSRSSLSIILWLYDSESGDEFPDRLKILQAVRSRTRATDICGFINEKTLGILLPDTDATGAKEICEKLMQQTDIAASRFSISTYPDQIFESLAKNGCIRPDTFPFALEEAIGPGRMVLALKRAIDIVGALAGIVLFMPVMLITAIAIKATSPGPVVFKQSRLGRRGAPFTFYKFRSMRTDMDDAIHRDYIEKLINGETERANQGDGEAPFFKIKDDPRITPVGRFIRKTSIDELPQFFNVLKGEMSLVGPRPPLAYEAEKYQAWQLRRILEMKPGITGLWQVEGRSLTDWDNTVRLDIRYLQNWSLLFDFKILLKTFKEVCVGRGAV